MPDSFWKWIGIPILLFQLESEPWSPASPPEASVLSCQTQFRFLSIVKKRKASSPFEALNSVCLSRCQSDMILPVQMRRRPRAFSRDSTGDSDIPSSCDMKHEPKFKPLQGNPAFFWVRPLAVHSTLDRKHRVPLTNQLLRENCTWGACGKLAHLFSQIQGISSHLETICGAWNFLHAAVLKWIFI